MKKTAKAVFFAYIKAAQNILYQRIKGVIALSAEKDIISYCKVYFEGEKEKDFECDAVVPDSEPDICDIVLAEQQNYLTDTLLANGKLTVRGKSAVNVICRAEVDESVVFITKTFDFEHVFDTDNVPNDAKVKVELEKGYVSCRVLNSRKVGIKSMLKINVLCVGNVEAEIFTGGECTEVLTKKCTYAELTGCDEKCVKITEDVEIDSTLPPIEKVLFTSARAYCADRKIINNRVIVKGILETKTFYLAQDKTVRSSTAEIPFNHIFNIDGVDENSVCVVIMNIKSVSSEVYDSDAAENRVTAIEAELCCTVIAYSEKDTVICEDAFSTTCDCITEKCMLSFCGKPCEAVGMSELKDKIEFGSAVATVSTVWAEASVNRIDSNDGVLKVYGDIFLSALVISENGATECAESKVPFEIKADLDGCNCKCIKADTVVTNISYTAVSADAIEVSGNIRVNIQCAPNINAEAVCGLQETGKEKACSGDMLIYYPASSERYWDIAKHYGVSVAAIKSVNSCDGDICSESMLIIPKL